MNQEKDNYSTLFKIEVEGWIHGISRYHGEFNDDIINGIVKELGPSVRRMIKEGNAFDLVDIVIRINKACRNMVEEVKILLGFLSNFPPSQTLQGAKRKNMLLILSKVEQSYPGALAVLKDSWLKKLAASGYDRKVLDVATEEYDNLAIEAADVSREMHPSQVSTEIDNGSEILEPGNKISSSGKIIGNIKSSE